MRRVSLRTTAVMLATAAGVAWLAVDSGTYSVSDRTAAAIVIWWALGLAVAVGVLPTGALRGWTLAAAGLLAAFAAWNAASIAWAPSAERAYDEFTRVLLYLGIFLLVALMASAVGPSPIADGIALGIVAIAVLALADRFFPGLMSHHDVIQFAPGTQARLAYPIGYWDGVGIFVALGLPLLLRRAVGRDVLVVRAAAVAPIPVLAAVIYLASSRGAVGVLAVGAVAFLLLTPRRWAAAGALAVGAAGAAAAIAVLRARPELVDGPAGSAAATSPGHSAAALVLSICLVAGALHAAGVVLLDG